jgi:hypothetical protein
MSLTMLWTPAESSEVAATLRWQHVVSRWQYDLRKWRRQRTPSELPVNAHLLRDMGLDHAPLSTLRRV